MVQSVKCPSHQHEELCPDTQNTCTMQFCTNIDSPGTGEDNDSPVHGIH